MLENGAFSPESPNDAAISDTNKLRRLNPAAKPDGLLVPQELMLLAAAGLFLYFGYRFWRDADGAEEDQSDDGPHGSGLFTSFTLIVVAELGDKTQLAMIALAAGTGEIWSVFTGGTLALWTVSLIGILLGATLLRRIPKHRIHRAAALMFVIFGVLALGQVMLNGNGLGVA